MGLWLVIGKEKFYVYRKENQNMEPEYIDGNPYRKYAPNDIKRDTESLLEALADNFNMGSTDELELSVVENSDRVRTANVVTVLGKRLKEMRAPHKLIAQAMQDLQKDKSLHIGEFGVNYDGDSYQLLGSEAKQTEYSLLGYRLEPDKLMQYC